MDRTQSLEEKWDLLDENEQKMVDSYMNNLLSGPDGMVLNLDDFPARKKKMNTGGNAVLVNPEYALPTVPEEEPVAPTPTPAPVPTEHKEANPGPLGLLGFGMTTVLLNLHNAGIIELSVLILSMGLMMGGLGQIIAGIMEFKNGNTFGATAFSCYGLFWWSLVIILVNPESLGGEAASHAALGYYMLLWCIFTFFMYFGTLKSSIAMRVVFGSLTILFFLLAVENFSGNAYNIGTIAGFEGIFCGASAIYAALGNVLNEEYKRNVIPL